MLFVDIPKIKEYNIGIIFVKGKPWEILGRKAKGPDYDMVASYQVKYLDNWLLLSALGRKEAYEFC